ncbi:MAG: hypothetical protein V7K92_16405 [Nostoc sp.]|uniref:hypothetical protein n=1 Tax=Nostoc sp. TaxID=1180 RepID=UPI002FF0D5B5
MGFGEAARSSPTALLKTADARRPGIRRQALASPFGIWGTTVPLVVPRVEQVA